MRQRRPARSGRAKRPSRAERHSRRADGARAAVRRAEHGIEITLPERRTEPETVVAHLGPTNSGKTHDALAFLAEHGRGVYAGPLRMLAQEAHRRLSATLGEDKVGLVTGEERINPDAPIVCCTVEMAPTRGDVLVLDEVQWADDEERGSAWTQLLLAGEYRHLLVLGALDARPLVERAFPTAEIKVFERKLPLEFVGARSIRSLTPGTVVVAFSRKAVLALAGEVNRLKPGKVAVLYGAMPLASRRAEIDRFLSGEAHVCCATDVLGHGVNLPCETLLFAETTKFDGQERRDLHPWELAQIAGRAGRFGLVERGHVGVLTGIAWGHADETIVESALEPHVLLPSGERVYRIVDEARIRPRLADLGVDDPPTWTRRSPRGTGWRPATGRTRAGSPWSRSRRSGCGSTPSGAGWPSVDARLSLRGHVAARQRTGRRRRSRAARHARARRRRRRRAGAAPAAPARHRPDCATRRSRTQSVPVGRRASCAGSHCSTPVSAGSRPSAPPHSRTPRPNASSRGSDTRWQHRPSVAAGRAADPARRGSRSATAVAVASGDAEPELI